MTPSSLVRSLGVAAFLSLLLLPAQGQQTSNGYLQRLKDAEAGIAALPAEARNLSRTPQQNEAIRRFGSALQRLGTERAFTGDTAGAIAAFDAVNRRPRGKEDPAEAKIVDDASVEDAVQAIVAQARTRRIVLLNEGHNMPMHRAFSQRVARELRKIGYTYLACETFETNPPQAFAAGYPNQNGGRFTRDPVFGAWIAEAIADHWKLIAYEADEPPPGTAREQQPGLREEGQARKLVERIFARDKDAKVLIHVGYGHLYKGSAKLPSGAELMMMGEHLRRMTGLSALHVDQTQFYAHPDEAGESPLYARMLAKPGTAAPFVLRSKLGEYAVLQGAKDRVDMQVVFPRYAFSDRNGRPGWLASLAGRTPRDIPAALLPASGRRAVLAYRAGEPADAVPADVVLVEAGKPVPKLMLPQGEYRFMAED